MKRAVLTLLLVATTRPLVMAQSNIDPARRIAWSENVGWTNWRDANGAAQGVRVGAMFLAGFIWNENVGWINVGDGTPDALCGERPCYANLEGTDIGVNLDVDGSLHGLAWAENVGWINFDTASLDGDRAQFDVCERRLVGFAWGENVGWINLGDATTYVGMGPCTLADADCDGKVTGKDYTWFPSLSQGPNVAVDCPVFDSDEDGDIDLLDFAAMQVLFGSLFE